MHRLPYRLESQNYPIGSALHAPGTVLAVLLDEMSGYGSARVFAHRLGYNDAARLLQETLDEEKEADHKLNLLAEQSINVRAERA